MGAARASASSVFSKHRAQPSARYDNPIERHRQANGHVPDVHHIELVKTKGDAAIHDSHGHPIVHPDGKRVTIHGTVAIQAINTPIGHGDDALYYIWGHRCSPALDVSGYVRRGDLAHAPKINHKDTAHVGQPAPLTHHKYTIKPVHIDEKDFAFKQHSSQGTFADYGGGGRGDNARALVGGAHKQVVYLTWNLPDKHAGHGGGITHAMLTEGDIVTKCDVAPRTMQSVHHGAAGGWTKWFYVRVDRLHAFGWLMAEFEIDGKFHTQLAAHDTATSAAPAPT